MLKTTRIVIATVLNIKYVQCLSYLEIVVVCNLSVQVHVPQLIRLSDPSHARYGTWFIEFFLQFFHFCLLAVIEVIHHFAAFFRGLVSARLLQTWHVRAAELFTALFGSMMHLLLNRQSTLTTVCCGCCFIRWNTTTVAHLLVFCEAVGVK